MADMMDALPRQDRKLVQAMAEAANTSAQAMMAQIIREYLGLVRSAPEALPQNPMRTLAASSRRGA